MNSGIPGRPAVAVFLLMVVFVAAVIVSDIAASVVDPGGGSLSGIARFLVLALSIFIVVPRLLRLPTGTSTVSTFPADVGLARVNPIGRNLLLLIAIYATFAVSQLAGQWVFHIVSGTPFMIDVGGHSLLSLRTFTPAAFEEIVMRGVMLTYLLARFSKRRSVLVSSAVFAGIHMLNLLNPGTNALWVIAQVVWAFALGIMYAEVFIRTRSIYMPVMIHFLVNGSTSVWFHGLDGRSDESALYGIPFYGVIPAMLSLLWARLARKSD